MRRSYSGLIACLCACLAFAPLAAQDLSSQARFLSSFDWTEPQADFGGLSGFELADDALEFWAVSDRGFLLHGRLERPQSQITNATLIALTPLLDADGLHENRIEAHDAEGLAVSGTGEIFISYERRNRIIRQGRDGRTLQTLPNHPDFDRFIDNAGAEALAIDDTGRLFVIPEQSESYTSTFPLYRLSGETWDIVGQIPRHGLPLPVGLDFDDQNRLYLLERDFRGFFGFASRLRRFTFEDGAIVSEETLFSSNLGEHGNLEGLSIWRNVEGQLRATMIADDNFSPLQSTEIVEYALPN